MKEINQLRQNEVADWLSDAENSINPLLIYYGDEAQAEQKEQRTKPDVVNHEVPDENSRQQKKKKTKLVPMLAMMLIAAIFISVSVEKLQNYFMRNDIIENQAMEDEEYDNTYTEYAGDEEYGAYTEANEYDEYAEDEEYDSYTEINEDETMYKLQVGVFEQEEHVTKLADELISKGFPVYVKEEGSYFQVQVGVYDVKENAKEMKQAIEAEGYEIFMKEE